jgi:phosphoribosyl 1,2-cyclic phosphodiesterase
MTNITIKTLASGSSGNAYHISDGKANVLIECGIPIAKIKQGLNYRLSEVEGVLISHEHL